MTDMLPTWGSRHLLRAVVGLLIKEVLRRMAEKEDLQQTCGIREKTVTDFDRYLSSFFHACMYLREYLFYCCRCAIFCDSIAYTSDGQQHQLHIKKEPKPFGYCTSVICSYGFQFLNGAQHQLGFWLSLHPSIVLWLLTISPWCGRWWDDGMRSLAGWLV